MKLVHSEMGVPLMHHLKNLLENEGIACIIRNETLFMAAGELPPISVWPELWVEDSQYDSAREIIKMALSDEVKAGDPWICPGCGEEHEPQFTDCWNCGEPRPEGRE